MDRLACVCVDAPQKLILSGHVTVSLTLGCGPFCREKKSVWFCLCVCDLIEPGTCFLLLGEKYLNYLQQTCQLTSPRVAVGTKIPYLHHSCFFPSPPEVGLQWWHCRKVIPVKTKYSVWCLLVSLVCSGLPACTAYSVLIEVTEGARAAGWKPDETCFHDQQTAAEKKKKNLFHGIYSCARKAAPNLRDWFCLFVSAQPHQCGLVGVIQVATHFGSIVRRVHCDGVMEEVKNEHKKLITCKKKKKKVRENTSLMQWCQSFITWHTKWNVSLIFLDSFHALMWERARRKSLERWGPIPKKSLEGDWANLLSATFKVDQ